MCAPGKRVINKNKIFVGMDLSNDMVVDDHRPVVIHFQRVKHHLYCLVSIQVVVVAPIHKPFSTFDRYQNQRLQNLTVRLSFRARGDLLKIFC